MKIIIVALILTFAFCSSTWADVDTHRKLRRILQFTGPNSPASISERWNGVEDIQIFIDRAVSWRDGEPHITAAQIIAKEADWQAAKTQRDNLAARETFISRREAVIIRRIAIDELRAEGKIP